MLSSYTNFSSGIIYGTTIKINIDLIDRPFQDLMYKLRVTEKSSRQRISNESSSNLQMRKKLEESDAKIERLNKIIQVR